MDNKLPTLIASKDGRGRAAKGSAAELWVRLESFLSMRAPKTYETYIGILREWSKFLGSELGSDDSATLILGARDIHAMAFLRWLAGRPGEAPRMKRRESSRARGLSTYIDRSRSKKMGLEEQQSNATIAKKVAALRRMYRMLIGAGLIPLGKNPFDSDTVKSPPKDSGRKRPTEMVPFELVKRIISATDDSTPKGIQDRAILSCLFGGGLRRSEIVALRLGDVRKTAKGTVFVYLRATKAGKDAQQAVPRWTAEILARQVHERKKQRADSGDYLFCSFRGRGGKTPTPEPLSASGVYKLFKLYCRKAGAGDFLTPHSARATAITKLLADGIPHRRVQEFSRHSSIMMVELYDKRRMGVEENPAKDLDFDK